MTLGVHFALSATDMKRTLAIDDPEELVDWICEDLEERYLGGGEWSFATDKAWDAIHRCLADGRLEHQTGSEARAHAILGGQQLDAGDDYFAYLLRPNEVSDVSASLAGITRDWLRARYETLKHTDYQQEVDDEDFEYTWENFQGLSAFFAKAAQAGRGVMFTVSG